MAYAVSSPLSSKVKPTVGRGYSWMGDTGDVLSRALLGPYVIQTANETTGNGESKRT